MIQPSVLTSIARNHDFRGRGLLARFLYAVPVSKVGNRVVGAAVVPEDVIAEYGGLIKGLALTLSGWHDPALLQLSPQAAEMLDDMARELEPQLGPDGELHHIADWGSKLVGAVGRIAALMHLAEHPTDGWRLPVEASSMARAIHLGAYYKGQALYAFDQMRVDPARGDADYLLGVVRGLEAPVVSRRDLQGNVSRSRFPTAKDLDGPLKLLEDHGYLLRQMDTSTKSLGRPASPTWLVHPSVSTADTWEPLIAVTDLAGRNWPRRARTAAVARCGEADQGGAEASLGDALLADCHGVFTGHSGASITSEELVRGLRALSESPWDAFDLNPTSLARRLKDYGIRPDRVRNTAGTQMRGYRLADFTDAFARYVPEPTDPPSQPDSPSQPDLPPVTDQQPATDKTVTRPQPVTALSRANDGVTAQDTTCPRCNCPPNSIGCRRACH